jgi:hypothetical protein
MRELGNNLELTIIVDLAESRVQINLLDCAHWSILSRSPRALSACLEPDGAKPSASDLPLPAPML